MTTDAPVVCDRCLRRMRSHGTRDVRGVVLDVDGRPTDVVRPVVRWFCPRCGDVVDRRDDPDAVRALAVETLLPPPCRSGRVGAARARTVLRRWDEAATVERMARTPSLVVVATGGGGRVSVILEPEDMSVLDVLPGPHAIAGRLLGSRVRTVVHDGPPPFAPDEGVACVPVRHSGRRDARLPRAVWARAVRSHGEGRVYACTLEALVRRTSFGTVRRGAFLAPWSTDGPRDVLEVLRVAREFLRERRTYEADTARGSRRGKGHDPSVPVETDPVVGRTLTPHDG